MTNQSETALQAAVENETLEVGRRVWDSITRRSATMFERRWWDDRILSWAMADESIKVQMFRFVDVLPMLRTHESVARHLQEYFDEVRQHLPWAVRMGLDISQPDSILGKALALNARSNAQRMAKRFIAGERVEDVIQTLARLRKQGFPFTLDLLGEATISEREADKYQQSYLDLMTGLAPLVSQWPENRQIDFDDSGAIPRINVSLKLSALYSQFKPIDPVGAAAGVKPRLRKILQTAREIDAYVHVDMEQYAYKNLTIEIFKQVLMEKEFRDFANVGIVIQTYLPDAEKDLARLLEWAKQRGTPISVRLVKGAYWDYETVIAKANGWPIPVYQQKWQSDENFERQTRFLIKNHNWLRPQFGSHNLRSLAHAIAWAKHLHLPQNALEIQMLYGMGDDMAHLFSEMGHRVRIYTPFGELIPGMAYLVRRLLENTSNDSFLRHSFTEHVSVEDLLMPPTRTGSTPPPIEEEPREFVNEPHTDFSITENRDAMQAALEEVENQLGEEHALIINGRPVDTKGAITSRNPSNHSQIIGIVASASPDEALDAIDAARSAFRRWSQVSVDHRAEYLEVAAAEMRSRRFELAAWQVLECGKPWDEADADVAEAIDFCIYYALQMRKLSNPRECNVPGEENTCFYRPRGVTVVIAPWNFPLAILTGMTVAALVAGNTVIMKPAEQSSVIAAKLMQIFLDSGLPEGVVNFLPGVGEEVGPELVGNPDVDVIAFTGSRQVGLAINASASETDNRQTMVKKVIAEMGGKNAIIVDDDADLDEAVTGVVHSTFGYAGQKCSACSRTIVLENVYDAFLGRLIEATRSLTVGPAKEPGTKVGPVIDATSVERIQEYIAIGKQENTLALEYEIGDLAEQGNFVGPHIFTDVDPSSRIAQEEIFGPVLAVIKVADMDEALHVANSTDYALTGGIFSRSPANLNRAKMEFQVGNLYLNRSCTGALVERQPFGGFKMSGIGSKAGGPDYLQQFLIPVNITENTMRRGFAPPADDQDEDASES